MAMQNLNLVLKNLCAVNTAKQGRDAVAGVLGLRMPPALSHGRPMSPGFVYFDNRLAEPVVETAAKRIGRSANLPGKPVRSRDWHRPFAWATSCRTGTTGTTFVSGRALSDRCQRHQQTSGHDYPSHDRRDVPQSIGSGRMQPRIGSALTTNRGK
jgi:hypothetical protein